MSVLVTGGTGYIALHIIDQLLAKAYPVVTTVRSVTKGDDLVEKFRGRYPEADISYEIVEDIAAEVAFETAIKARSQELKFLLHTASPFNYGHKGDLDSVFVKPAVNGTVGILNAVNKHAPGVSKVVVTSSFAAIWNFDADASFVHTEKIWSSLKWEDSKDVEWLAYCYSKALAERSAWDFVRTASPSFEFSVVAPPLVIGPQCFDVTAKGSLNVSADYIGSLLNTTPADDGQLPDEMNLISADVRDVAAYHILILEKDDLGGKRLVPTQGNFTQQKALNYINENFSQLKGKISIGKPDGVEDQEKKIPTVDFSKSRELTHLIPTSVEKSIHDSVEQLLRMKLQG